MDQGKFGKFIKDIRKKNNLTQKELADKYGVTYQAVSKWETGKNMPDIMLIKQMSKDFNVELSDMFEGEYKSYKGGKNRNLMFGLISVLLIIFIGLIVFLVINNNVDGSFEFKTLTTGCDDFNISGSIAYNQNKSSIYISHVDYCGGNDAVEYEKIDCTLYESHQNMDVKISSCNFDGNSSIKLEDYLKNVKINVDNYASVCKDEYRDSSLYLLINATDKEGKVTSYKIPLLLEENCSVE